MTPARRILTLGLIVLAMTQALPSVAAGTTRAATEVPLPAPARRAAHWLHVRVWEPGAVAPSVSVRVPTAVVSVSLGLLSWTGVLDRAIARAEVCARDDGGPHLRLKGRNLVALWSEILRGGASDLVMVEEGNGGRVVVRLE